jgi:hypothetical protein
MVLEPQHSIGIFTETLRFSQLHSSPDVTHSNIHLLGSNNFFFDSWDESYNVQHTLWNNSKTWLFWIRTRSEQLNHEMIAMLLAA